MRVDLGIKQLQKPVPRNVWDPRKGQEAYFGKRDVWVSLYSTYPMATILLRVGDRRVISAMVYAEDGVARVIAQEQSRGYRVVRATNFALARMGYRGAVKFNGETIELPKEDFFPAAQKFYWG